MKIKEFGLRGGAYVLGDPLGPPLVKVEKFFNRHKKGLGRRWTLCKAPDNNPSTQTYLNLRFLCENIWTIIEMLNGQMAILNLNRFYSYVSQSKALF